MGPEHLHRVRVLPQSASYLHYVRHLPGRFQQRMSSSDLMVGEVTHACVFFCNCFVGTRPFKDIQDPRGYICGLHDDIRRSLSLWCCLPQQPARCWRGPVYTHPPVHSGPRCRFLKKRNSFWCHFKSPLGAQFSLAALCNISAPSKMRENKMIGVRWREMCDFPGSPRRLWAQCPSIESSLPHPCCPYFPWNSFFHDKLLVL